jgi:RimJ/RimL family protein N-acetyltransferase
VGSIPPCTAAFRGGACTLRTAEEDDAAALVAHMEHMSQTDPHTVRIPGEGVRTVEQVAEFARTHRENPGQLMIVAVVPEGPSSPPGGIIGALRFACGDRQRVAHHGHFGISAHADWRGRGVGSALIGTLLDWAAAHPAIEKVCLGVLEPNAGARRLYTRMGFVQECRLLRYFKFGPDQYVNDVQMAIYVKPGVAPEGFLTWPVAPGLAAATAGAMSEG